ncbi:MAG: methionyl-tRNA formyltransferase [Acidobacteriota bacterium]
MPTNDRLVFYGTRRYAIPTLDALRESERTPLLIVAEMEPLPDEPEEPWGPYEPPAPWDDAVAAWAREHDVPLVLVEDADSDDLVTRVKELEADAGVAVAFRLPLPKRLIDLPTHGTIGVHPSLLPKYRGPSPIRASLNGGESKAGVTTIQLTEDVDAGPILLQEEVPVEPSDTYPTLHDQLATLGATLGLQTVEVLGKKGRGKLKPRQQNEKSATTVPLIDHSHRKVPWSLEADGVFNRLRAFGPEDGLVTYFKLRPVEVLSGMPLEWVQAPFGNTGTYLGMRQGRLAILCGNNSVFGIDRLRRPGSEAMSAADFVKTEEMRVGDSFV